MRCYDVQTINLGAKVCNFCHPAYAQRQATARKQRMCKPLLNRISIDQRPPEVDGKRFGDWEMDTIVGPNNKGAIVRLPSYCP